MGLGRMSEDRWFAGDPVNNLEDFRDVLVEVLGQCGRMPPYMVDLNYRCAVNQICLIADSEDQKPYRVLITLEEV